MTKKSIAKRIRVTKTGKIRRRAMALGHNRGNKRTVQMQRKMKKRGLDLPGRKVKKYL